MNHVDLYTGIGGFSIASEWAGFETVAFAELDPEASLVLRQWRPGVPNVGDVCKARWGRLRRALGAVDLLTGGVPCQPASLLGRRMGSADERWLWPETIGIVRVLRPRACVFENPPAILSLEDGRAFAGILGGLAACGYDVLWGSVFAAAFDAGHLRERVAIIATDAQGVLQRPGLCEAEEPCSLTRFWRGRPCNAHVQAAASNSHHARLEGHTRDAAGTTGWHDQAGPTAARDLRGRVFATGEGEKPWWHETHTGIPVLADGIPVRLAEAAARCTGNAIVPQAFYPILSALRGMMA